MKKISAFILCLVLMATIAYAESVPYSMVSTVKTATALIYTGDIQFNGIIIATDGTNAVTLDVYDGTTTAGTKVIPQLVIPSSATNRSFALSVDPGIHMYTGIYVVISVAGSGSASYTVYYK
jgi:hypothetical protein